MFAEFDTKTLMQKGLNAHQFLIALMIHEKEFGLINEYLTKTSSQDHIQKDIKTLTKKKLIHGTQKGMYDFSELSSTPDLIKVITGGNQFDELYQTYPKSVIRPDGTEDYLRTDLSKSRAIYHRLTNGSIELHEHLLNCLRKELEEREDKGTMQYIQRLPKWLSSQSWKSYDDRVRDSESVIDTEVIGYGLDIE